MTSMIETLWNELGGATAGLQRRVDATHPHDIYADFASPDRPGLVVLCNVRPAATAPLRSITVETGMRDDGRWALHLVLVEPTLRPVFAALCSDIVSSTRQGVATADLARAVLVRIERWRALLLRDRAGLDETALRGLIAELHVFETLVAPGRAPAEAVSCWRGPFGAAQDFQLPDGPHFEVKSASPNATTVRINGLNQLDAGGSPLSLLVVRMQTTGLSAPGRLTAPDLIARLKRQVGQDPAALVAFDDALAALHWHEHPAHDAFAVHIVAVDRHEVDAGFPRLLAATAPLGVLDADYTIALPPLRTGS